LKSVDPDSRFEDKYRIVNVQQAQEHYFRDIGTRLVQGENPGKKLCVKEVSVFRRPLRSGSAFMVGLFHTDLMQVCVLRQEITFTAQVKRFTTERLMMWGIGMLAVKGDKSTVLCQQ
jgi:hypothetical protein